MRNLTITRKHKSAASLCSTKIYISDPADGSVEINGVNCRLLGTIKNGETQTFLIDECEARVFAIFDIASKDYCNDSVLIFAGCEDVFLSGGHVFNPACGNAFRFDGEPDAFARSNRSKGNGIGAVILIVSLVAGLMLGGIFAFYILR